MLEQLADHDDELLEQLLMDQAPTPREGVPGPRPRDRRKPRRVGAVRLGEQLLGRSPPAQGAAPRSARAASRPPTASSVTDPALYVFKVIHGSIGRLALVARARRPDRRGLRPQDRTTASTPASGRCSRSRAKRPQKVSEGRDGDVVAVAKVDDGQGRRMARRGQAAAAGRDRLSGAQLRDRDRTRRPQG